MEITMANGSKQGISVTDNLLPKHRRRIFARILGKQISYLLSNLINFKKCIESS